MFHHRKHKKKKKKKFSQIKVADTSSSLSFKVKKMFQL